MKCPHGYPSPLSCVDCMNDVGVGGEPPAPVEVEATFFARYDGDCPACHLGIHVGQLIAKLSDGRYIHDACVR